MGVTARGRDVAVLGVRCVAVHCWMPCRSLKRMTVGLVCQQGLFVAAQLHTGCGINGRKSCGSAWWIPQLFSRKRKVKDVQSGLRLPMDNTCCSESWKLCFPLVKHQGSVETESPREGKHVQAAFKFTSSSALVQLMPRNLLTDPSLLIAESPFSYPVSASKWVAGG